MSFSSVQHIDQCAIVIENMQFSNFLTNLFTYHLLTYTLYVCIDPRRMHTPKLSIAQRDYAMLILICLGYTHITTIYFHCARVCKLFNLRIEQSNTYIRLSHAKVNVKSLSSLVWPTFKRVSWCWFFFSTFSLCIYYVWTCRSLIGQFWNRSVGYLRRYTPWTLVWTRASQIEKLAFPTYLNVGTRRASAVVHKTMHIPKHFFFVYYDYHHRNWKYLWMFRFCAQSHAVCASRILFLSRFWRAIYPPTKPVLSTCVKLLVGPHGF